MEKLPEGLKFSIGDRVYLPTRLEKGVGVIVSNPEKDHVWSSWRYMVEFNEGVEGYIEHMLKHVKDYHAKCECGAVKVFGKNCSLLHHATWCPARAWEGLV